jgi:hypothetical protein
MTQEQMSLFHDALAGMKTISVAASQSYSADSLSDVLQRNHIQNGSIDLKSLTATGFSHAGMTAIIGLAKTFRPSSSQNSQKASNATLAKFIAAEIIAHWKARSVVSLTTADFDQFRAAVENWFAAQTQVRQHVVACTLFPHRIGSFSVGPVTFYHLHDLPTEDFGISREEFWPEPPPRWKRWLRNVWAAIREKPVNVAKPGGLQFEQFIEFAVQRHAPWIALIDIPGRAPAESTSTADVAADVALAVIQIVCPGDDMRHLARATGRAAPIWRADISLTSGNNLSTGTSNRVPALGRAPELLIQHLASAKPLLESMGRRLAAYLAATSSLPDLDEAWCNAAYWYHEALAESLDTVAVAKLETAIEVLFRAESMSGSKKLLLDSFDAIFGLKGSDLVNPPSTVTVEQLVVAITTARSRVLHGTWPTLVTDLPSVKGKPAVSYGDVEFLTRTLLLQFSLHMDAYQAAGETDDTTDALITWIKAERVAQAAASMPAP